MFKAPANELLTDVLDLALPAELPTTATAIAIDNRIQDQLNPEGINCL
ncbi:MAG: hypothetical protein HC881_22245, partial [Leptolyngbyaceae cyanobacterium SL_7_1]|nr:hypothetical protein [Leptolyngbyaceae cyanobacterium SL_7_1]